MAKYLIDAKIAVDPRWLGTQLEGRQGEAEGSESHMINPVSLSLTNMALDKKSLQEETDLPGSLPQVP